MPSRQLIQNPKFKIQNRTVFEKYLRRVIAPYFLLSWIVLTLILFLQQGTRFTEILFGAGVSARLLAELSLALAMTIASFTVPMALLTGIVIGLARLRGDSELNAAFAAGVSPRRILMPCLMIAAVVSAAALWVNLEGVPLASQIIRRVTLEAALLKLESPIEPGIFNTEFNNYVIYVRDGNNEEGIWERVFIYLPENENQKKLITARSGRIDADESKSELVLSDAVVTTLPTRMGETADPAAIAVEKIDTLRVTLETGRQELRRRLAQTERFPDEMGLAELSAYSAQKTGAARLEAEILWHRRLSLSFAPLVLTFLAVAVSLRFGRGGRGWGVGLALLTLILFYLLTLAGEQGARAEWVSTGVGGWFAGVSMMLVSLWWLRRTSSRITGRFNPLTSLQFSVAKFFKRKSESKPNRETAVYASDNKMFLFGLLERDLFKNLCLSFLFICVVLIFLFFVFTTFEVLRGVRGASGIYQLGWYLFFLSPYIFWQIAPTALMLAILTVYTQKKSRQEIAVWGAAGQSVYILLLPCWILAGLIGWTTWELQERVLPRTNPRQDVLRAQLRGGGAVANQSGRSWVATENGLYSFVGKRGENKTIAAEDISFYQFDADQIHLRSMRQAATANYDGTSSAVALSRDAMEIVWRRSFVETKIIDSKELNAVGENPFDQVAARVSHLDAAAVQKNIEQTDSLVERRRLMVALERKYTILVLPLVLAFFSAPLAVGGGQRRGGIGRTLGGVIAVWLIFVGSSAVFERFGIEGILPPTVAVWSPLVIFSSLGWFWLARARS